MRFFVLKYWECKLPKWWTQTFCYITSMPIILIFYVNKQTKDVLTEMISFLCHKLWVRCLHVWCNLSDLFFFTQGNFRVVLFIQYCPASYTHYNTHLHLKPVTYLTSPKQLDPFFDVTSAVIDGDKWLHV